jgi:hypothetical protein
MSFENTHCPCGGQKPPDTFLCDACLAFLANRPELAGYQDPRIPVEARRHAAVILVSLSRARLRNQSTPQQQHERTA